MIGQIKEGIMVGNDYAIFISTTMDGLITFRLGKSF